MILYPIAGVFGGLGVGLAWTQTAMIVSEKGGKDNFGSNWGFQIFGVFIGIALSQAGFDLFAFIGGANEFGVCASPDCIMWGVVTNLCFVLLGLIFGFLSYHFAKSENKSGGLNIF